MVMKNIIKWFKKNRDSIIRNTFLLPILLVVAMSISHVVTWYGLGNPISWAIYLSVAIEVFALASVAAASIDIKKGSIWFLFGLVTTIQIIGNVFFEYQYINIEDPLFLSWMELIQPLFADWDVIDHRRLLATIQGGTLPIMSLTALHFFIKFTEKKLETEKAQTNSPIITEEEVIEDEPVLQDTEAPQKSFKEQQTMLKEIIDEARDNTTVDVEDVIANVFLDELEKTIEKEKVEDLDEDEFLKEEIKESESPENLMNTRNNTFANRISELDKNEEKSKQGDGKTFGPPHMNNI